MSANIFNLLYLILKLERNWIHTMTLKIYDIESGNVYPTDFAQSYYAREVREGRAIYVYRAYRRLKAILKRDLELLKFCKDEAVKRQFVIHGKSFFDHFLKSETIEFNRLKIALEQDDTVMGNCIKEAIRKGHKLS